MAYEEERFDPEDYSEGSFDDPEPEDENLEEIDEEEREALEQDLVDVKTLKNILSSRGVRGVVVYCPDCEDDHFLDWDLLAANLEQILKTGEPPVHEPAWEPDPDEYVGWDYARGFLDGFETYPEEHGGGETCGYCGNALPPGGYEWAFCPSCGKELAPINLVLELRRRGWSGEQIGKLLDRTGFERPLFDLDDPNLRVEPPGDGPDGPAGE